LDQASTLDELADRPELSVTLDEACLQTFPRRDLTDEEADAAANGRALAAAGIDGVYAATAQDGRVIALLRDDGPRTKSVVVIRPATL
jgi:tRNA pseudouridine55 synthase